jgi:hypothetical protein
MEVTYNGEWKRADMETLWNTVMDREHVAMSEELQEWLRANAPLKFKKFEHVHNDGVDPKSGSTVYYIWDNDNRLMVEIYDEGRLVKSLVEACNVLNSRRKPSLVSE